MFFLRAARFRAIAAVLCTLFISLSAHGQFEVRGTFLAQYNSSPQSIAVGDFNHDGILDLAVVSYCCGGSGVSILLGKGDGTFAPGVVYAAGDQPLSVVAADLNRDGNLDLAVANSLSPYLTILLGEGDGTFRYGSQSPRAVYENFITVGDFNGDGIPDLVALSNNNPCKCISVLLGNGDGTFQEAVVTDPPFVVYTIGTGDFNGDGKLDLATAGNYSVNILLGNGDGTFRYGASYPSESDPTSIAVADFRADNKLDLAIADGLGVGISVFLGNGDGTFQTAVDYPTNFPVSVAVADFNGDHKLDLVVANSAFPSGASVLLGNGDGTFQPSIFYTGGYETSYVAAGDFNGDGKPDFVLADMRYDTVLVMLNTGVVTFSPTKPMNFKTQAVGTTSPPREVTLTNTGSADLKITSMKVTGAFSMTSTCGATVAPNASCTITATFTPTRKGEELGAVSIVDSASTKPQVIELMGTGTQSHRPSARLYSVNLMVSFRRIGPFLNWSVSSDRVYAGSQ